MVPGDVQVRAGVSPDQALNLAAALARHSLHPVSRTLATAGANTPWLCDTARETPGSGIQGLVYCPPQRDQGDPNSAGEPLIGARELWLGGAQFCGVEPVASEDLCVYLSDSEGWLATFTLREALREQATEVVAQLQSLPVEVHLLSGDQSQSVARIATALGITNARGGCSPSQKLDLMREMQERKRRVVMVGDGLNDGPVLAGAQVSFAFGKAMPLAQSKSDFVVLGGQLANVLDTLLLARKTMRIVRQNLWWALLYNAACVPLAVVGWLPAWLAGLGMACSSIVVVANALRLTRPVRWRKLTVEHKEV